MRTQWSYAQHQKEREIIGLILGTGHSGTEWMTGVVNVAGVTISPAREAPSVAAKSSMVMRTSICNGPSASARVREAW